MHTSRQVTRRGVGVVMAAVGAIGAMSLSGVATAQKPFAVAVFPDTQLYSRDHPETYEAMCRWIVENREPRNIVFVSHIGDIVQDDEERQWVNARRAHDVLSEAGIAYGMAIGNHDGEDMYQHELTGKNYLRFFGHDSAYDLDNPAAGTFAEQPWWGGHSPSGLSTCQTLDPALTGGVPMLFVHLEVGMRREEVDWARGVIAEHPGRVAILSTHRYLYDWRTIRGRYTPYIYEQFDPMYVGQDVDAGGLFEGVIASSPTAMMVWCGHNDGELRRTATNAWGRPVHEMLHDYSHFSRDGGEGWFRLYTFDPASGEVRADTFSPTMGRFRTMSDQIDDYLEAVHVFSDEGRRRAGMDLSTLDAGTKGLIVSAFTRPGSMSRFIHSMKTGVGEFAWVLPMIDRTAGDDASRVREQIAGFPWDDLSPGLVRLLDREGGPIVRAFLDGDRGAIDRLFTENGHGRLIEAFLSDGDRSPSFTLKVDFGAYLKP